MPSSRSEWSIHLPVNIGGSFGRLQVFVIPGDTPFLLGRPVLKHFKIQIDYAEQTRSPSMAVLGLQPSRGDVKST